MRASAALWTSLATARAAWQCYLPNGDTTSDVPCDLNAPVSSCCGTRAACLSNGLCLQDQTTPDDGISYARGTCTDQSWQSPVCPQHCQLNQDTGVVMTAYDFRAGGVQVWECGAKGYGRAADYCCESAGEKTRCCSTSTAVFSLPSASIGNALQQSVITSSSSSSSFSSSSSIGGTPNVATSPAATEHVSPDGSEGLSVGAKAGIGLGVGAGALVAGALVFWYVRKGRATKQVNDKDPRHELHSDGRLTHRSGLATRVELPTKTPVHELGIERQTAELPARSEWPVR